MNKLRKILVGIVAFSLVFSGSFAHLSFSVPNAYAATLTTGSASIGDSRPSQTNITYTIDFSNVTTSAIQCINVVFSDSATGGSVPTGMSTASAALSGTSDYIPTPASWTADGSTTNGTVSITYATGETPASSSARTVVLTGINNGSTADTAYYVQFDTYNNTDCASSAVDTGVIAFIYTAGVSASVTVDPSLSFAVAGVTSGTAINGTNSTVTTTATTYTCASGDLTTSQNCLGGQQLTVGTNASNGYTVYIRYTGALTNGASDTITDHTGSNASPSSFPAAGVAEAFGYTTEDSTLSPTADRFTNPAGGYAAFTTSNAEVMYGAGTASSDVIEIGYQTAITAATEAGTYTSTIILTATPTY